MKTTPPRDFQGVLSHSSLPDGRAAATLTIRGDSLHIEAAETTLHLPLKGLKLAWGGANNSLLFISHPLNPDYSCFTRDRTILEAMRPFADSRLLEELRQLNSHSKRRRHMALAVVVALLAVVWGLFALRKPATALLARAIPISWERKLGQAVYVGVRAQTAIIDNAELTKELENLVAPLVNAAADSGYTFEFHIAKEEQLNAFALPGGIIVVNSGTILKAERPEEVLGVLAHELSHVTQRHMTQQVITVFGLYVVVDFLMGNVFGTIAALGQGATYLLQQGFSREHEQEADIYGLQLLAEANIDPHGMVEFFRRVQKEYEDVGVLSTLDKTLSFLSTHPATDERIAYLLERIKTSSPGPYRTMSRESFEAFRTKLRGNL